MAETSDFTSFIEIVEHDFHSSHGAHFLVIMQEFVCVGIGLSGELVAFEVEGVIFGLDYIVY